MINIISLNIVNILKIILVKYNNLYDIVIMIIN